MSKGVRIIDKATPFSSTLKKGGLNRKNRSTAALHLAGSLMKHFLK